MAATYPLIVGIFQQEADAKKALQALYGAGFEKDQVGIALREGGVVTHSLLNDLVKLGVPQDRASYYESEYKAGRPIVSVRADGREQEARDILGNYGAIDEGQQGGYAQTTSDTTVGTDREYANQGEYTNDQQQALRLREERLNVNKERVQSGEARLHKDVIEEQQSIDVPVTHEEVYIERRAVTGDRVSDAPIGQDEVIRVPVNEEQVNVTKTAVETGEVTIKKRAVTENQRVSDTVRHEEARLEKDGNPRIVTGDNIATNDTIATNDDIVNP
jgi:uncharacterized protein (TIGR02271 family)